MVGNPAEEQVEVAKPHASFGPGAQGDGDLQCLPSSPGWVQHPLIGGISFIHLFLPELGLVD